VERGVKPRRIDAATRATLAFLSHWFARRSVLIGYEIQYEYLLHDRDNIFSGDLDKSVKRLGLRALKSPPRSPTANAICERLIGTIRRDSLEFLICRPRSVLPRRHRGDGVRTLGRKKIRGLNLSMNGWETNLPKDPVLRDAFAGIARPQRICDPRW
jgi:hypothetical protein